MSTVILESDTQATGDSLVPEPGESYSQFVHRAHYSLMGECPDWEDRNQRVWSAWETHSGEPLRERAQKYFSGHRFVPNVCYFSEHETVGSNGKPVRYSFNELAGIVDEHNSRADRHNYAAITERHTADGPDRIKLEPKVVGFVGTARLGMVGNENPMWAVFADEHHKTDAYSQNVLANKQRRSVEVNRYRDGRAPYFDPVAVLGADSPRLPLPVARYSSEGEEVDRYSVVAPAMVSGSNSFIPQFGPTKDRKYEGQQTMGLTPEDIQAVVQAIMSTPQMQWVEEQMNGGGQGNQQPPMGGAAQMGGGQGPEQQYGARPLPRYEASEDDDLELVEKYNALNDQHKDLVDKYSNLIKQHGEVRSAVVELERRECDKDRELSIRELYSNYPHFVVVEEELDRCLYSRGSEMGQDQFDEHIESIEKYAQRSSPVTQMVPAGKAALETDTDKYTEDVSAKVVERYTVYANRGELKSYDEIEAEIRKEMAGA